MLFRSVAVYCTQVYSHLEALVNLVDRAGARAAMSEPIYFRDGSRPSTVHCVSLLLARSWARSRGEVGRILDRILNGGFGINERYQGHAGAACISSIYRATMLHDAIAVGRPDYVAELVARGADPSIEMVVGEGVGRSYTTEDVLSFVSEGARRETVKAILGSQRSRRLATNLIKGLDV